MVQRRRAARPAAGQVPAAAVQPPVQAGGQPPAIPPVPPVQAGAAQPLPRNWGSLASTTIAQAQEFYEGVKKYYLIAFILIVAYAFVDVAVGGMFNRFGLKGFNFVLLIPFLIIWAFFTFHPTIVLGIFGLGVPAGLPNGKLEDFIKTLTIPDVDAKELFKKGLELVVKYARWSAHVALFVITLHVVIGTWDLKAGWVLLPILEILLGVWILTILYYPNSFKWYRRCVLAILLVAVTLFLFQAFDFTPIGKAAKDAKDEATYKKTFAVEVRNLKDGVKFCGIRPGEREFHLSNQALVHVGSIEDGEDLRLQEYVLVNGTVAKQKFEVSADGCAELTIAVTSTVRDWAMAPQMLLVTTE